MSSKTSVDIYNESFFKKPDRVTPRYNRYKKHFSTLNPDFVNTNDGTVPSTQSNIVAIVNKDGSVKKTVMDSSISLSNDGQFISKANISTNRSQEHQQKTNLISLNINSDQDKKNPKADEKSNSFECNEFRKKLNTTKKCRRNKKQIKKLLSSEKKLKSALSKQVISNTDQERRSAHTQTEIKKCKYCTDDNKQVGLNRSSERIQYSKNKEAIVNNNTKAETPAKIIYDELQNKKKIITENHEKKQQYLIEHQMKDIEPKIVNENIIEINKTKNLPKKQSTEGETFQKFKILGRNNNKKIGYINKICSIFLFIIILCWFLSVVFKMNIPQDFAKIFFRYFTSLPIFTRHKRRELTKAEIGLKWVNGLLNLIKRVVGF